MRVRPWCGGLAVLVVLVALLAGLAEGSAEPAGASAHDASALLGSSAGKKGKKGGYVIPKGLSIRNHVKRVEVTRGWGVGTRQPPRPLTKPGDAAKKEKQRLLKAKRLIMKRMLARKDRENMTKSRQNAARASAKVKAKKVAQAQAKEEEEAVKREEASKAFAKAKRDPKRREFKAKGFKAAQEMKKAQKGFHAAMKKKAKRKAALAKMKQEEKQQKARTAERRKNAGKAKSKATKRIAAAAESKAKAKQAKKILGRKHDKKAVKAAVADEARVKRVKKMRQEARKRLQKKALSKKPKAPPLNKAKKAAAPRQPLANKGQSPCSGCLARCSPANAPCKTWCHAHWCVGQADDQENELGEDAETSVVTLEDDARGGHQRLQKALDKAATKVAAKAVKGVKKKATLQAKATSAAAVAKALKKVKKSGAKKAMKRLKRSLTSKEALEFKLNGCKNKLSASMCHKKRSLCKNKRFGSVVQKQCPRTCNLCQKRAHKSKRMRNYAVSCTPKRLVKGLAPRLMKASSRLSASKGADKAHLHNLASPWVAGRQRKGQWLQITLPQEMTVTAVETRGRFNANQWVTYYKLMHKRKHWRWYGGAKWLRGNWDRTHSKKHVIRPFKAKVLRFYPQKWQHKIAMRVEVYGCVEKKKKSVREKLAAFSSGSQGHYASLGEGTSVLTLDAKNQRSSCTDAKGAKLCAQKMSLCFHRTHKVSVQKQCAKTCGQCAMKKGEDSTQFCATNEMRSKCSQAAVAKLCPKSCRL